MWRKNKQKENEEKNTFSLLLLDEENIKEKIKNIMLVAKHFFINTYR